MLKQIYANDSPYTEGTRLIIPSTVSIPSQLVESNATGGVSASLGFACSLTPDSPHNGKNGNNNGLKCYYDTRKVSYSLKDGKPLIPFIFSKYFQQKYT